MDIEAIQVKLVESCQDLNTKYGILNNSQSKRCEEEIEDKQYDIQNREVQIFGEDRGNKVDYYYDLLRRVKQDLYQNYKGDNYDNTAITDITDPLNNIATNLKKILMKRYKNKEHSHFNLLLNSYNKIDANLKDKVNTHDIADTMNEKNIIENNKLKHNSYTLRLVILIIFIKIFIVLIIVYVKF